MRRMSGKLLIGADPELFLQKKDTGEHVSGHDAVPGTKEQPFPVECGAVQVDGVAVEFNINPAETEKEFIENIVTVVRKLDFLVNHSHPDCQLVATPTAVFKKQYFDDLPYHVKALGCSPDYNAWTGKENPKPKTRLPIRTGAGHVHLGWTDNEKESDIAHFYDCTEIVKQLDYTLFIPSHAWDNDRKRRTLYGNIGAFRPKHYGCEYRVLSNAWLRYSKIVPWIYQSIQIAYELLNDDEKLFEDKRLCEIMKKKTICID